MPAATPRTVSLSGHDVTPWLDDVARLRIAVFAEWPYLYAGDLDYEREYLARYAASPRSVFVLALAESRVVGVATGVPLADDAPAFQAPFRDAGIGVDGVFYFGESILLPAWRGRGLGHAFFDGREAHARALGGIHTTAFCSVSRDFDDPRRPSDARSHDGFWRSRGYAPLAGAAILLSWPEAGRGEVAHALGVWTRALERTESGA